MGILNNYVATRVFEGWLGSGFSLPVALSVETLADLSRRRAWMLAHLPELRGKDLMCWCADWTPGDGPRPDCHAAVLMERANA